MDGKNEILLTSVCANRVRSTRLKMQLIVASVDTLTVRKSQMKSIAEPNQTFSDRKTPASVETKKTEEKTAVHLRGGRLVFFQLSH